jgi:hypothetical protein
MIWKSCLIPIFAVVLFYSGVSCRNKSRNEVEIQVTRKKREDLINGEKKRWRRKRNVKEEGTLRVWDVMTRREPQGS